MADKKAFEFAASNSIIEFDQLTAAATATGAINLLSEDNKETYRNVLFQYVIAAITTNVVVTLQGSLDNVNWFNLHEDDSNTTKTGNGAYALMYQGAGEINYIRFYWVSESGGTAATIDIKAKIYGKGNPLWIT
jgi:hypothetical protein